MKEKGLEEAVYGRADHWVSEAGRGRCTGQGVMPATPPRSAMPLDAEKPRVARLAPYVVHAANHNTKSPAAHDAKTQASQRMQIFRHPRRTPKRSLSVDEMLTQPCPTSKFRGAPLAACPAGTQG